LLVNHSPGRQVVRHHSPHAAHLDQVAQGVENLAQGITTLRGCFGHQRQIPDAKRPLFITDIARITLSCSVHPQLNAGMYLQSTDNSHKKLSTGSSLASLGAEKAVVELDIRAFTNSRLHKLFLLDAC